MITHKSLGSTDEILTYTYDNNGNITHVRRNNVLIARYTYDGMNQLVREDNAQLSKTYVFEYDTAGNITSKKEYSYTTGTPTTLISTKAYGYSQSGWKDKLVSFDGQSITYDVLGNPLTYLGYTLTWDRVRQLKTFDNNTFAYDGFGKRCRKNSVYYLYDSDKLIKERRNGTSLVYFYDTTGICGFRYHDFAGENDTTAYYFYLKNLQGDVTAILDENGNVVAEYLYDAWGKCTITYDPIGIGEINPIRYRSYYYDTETGLYYLNSRYYDPNTGRFINADIGITTEQGIIGYNLFSYCCNNPIQMVDNNGTNPSAGALWSSSMWWLCSVDTVLPVGDIIYFGVWGLLAIATATTVTETTVVEIPFKTKEREIAQTKKKEVEIDSTPKVVHCYWSAEIIGGVVTPISPLTYSEAFAWAASENNLLCINHAAAIAIVKFFPSAVWDSAHRGGLGDGYLNHYHLSTAHKNHIWYYGV